MALRMERWIGYRLFRWAEVRRCACTWPRRPPSTRSRRRPICPRDDFVNHFRHHFSDKTVFGFFFAYFRCYLFSHKILSVAIKTYIWMLYLDDFFFNSNIQIYEKICPKFFFGRRWGLTAWSSGVVSACHRGDLSLRIAISNPARV
jgi:hypothetical protein